MATQIGFGFALDHVGPKDAGEVIPSGGLLALPQQVDEQGQAFGQHVKIERPSFIFQT
jgi:hypothetical protein